MTSDVTLYHNNRCSKSRAALALLQMRGLRTKVVDYLDTPLSITDLRDLMDKLGLSDARAMMRVKDDLYRELGLEQPDIDNHALLKAVEKYPQLLERPIAVAGCRAAIGRPLENIEAILPE
ncbi:arsenate reductase (glutaredoxin) [Neisseria sp. S1]|uniref:arsenate reductase (glutaredoxin) n=1 Tax=Neisseria sp. S1 TaxID=3318354 RepID=UPI003A848A3F